MSVRNREAIIRQWGLVLALHSRRRGLTADQLAKRIGISRATFYRYLEVLEGAGVPIQSALINGEKRFVLTEHDLPPLRPTPLQLLALRLARLALSPLAGASLVRELDKLLASYAYARGDAKSGRIGSNQLPVSLRGSTSAKPDKVQIVDTAIRNNKRLRLSYRGLKDPSPRWRLVDPAAFRLADDQLYLVAFDTERRAWRKFKVSRISSAVLLQERAVRHPDYDEKKLFGRSVKVWSGNEVEAAVRLSPEVARLAAEYPLMPDQTVHEQPDGSLIVRARVAGIIETSRWVLSWGKHAVALEPPELRKLVRDELQTALEGYRLPQSGKLKPNQVVSRDLRHRVDSLREYR